MNKTTILRTNQLTKTYKSVTCVDKVNMTLGPKQIYGFLGPNGAGKSTTLKMILGLTKPTSGNCSIFDKPFLENRLDILQQTGSLIESPSYYPHLSGYENLSILQRLKNLHTNSINEVLHIVGLEDQKDKLVKHYSLGMKQRLGIAMALIGFPKFLVLDEPTNGLDPKGIREMRELIKCLPSTFGITILLSTHLLSEIQQIATHVGIIHKGNLLYQESMTTLENKANSSIYIRCSSAKKAVAIAKELNITCHLDQDLLHVPYIKDHLLYKLVQGLIKANIPIYRIWDEKKSLEDIFLELTEKEKSI